MKFFSFLALNFMFFSVYSQPKKTLYLPDSTAIEFIFIPSGTFVMGSPQTEVHRDKDESPQVTIDLSSFWLGTYEVTQKQWLSVMGYNPSVFTQKVNHLDFPVESISWLEAQAFIEKLNHLGQGTFRLPTEAEWEYACRAETQTAYYWGDYENEWKVTTMAWINSRSMATTHPVGLKPANPWGLFDMSGNVWEWTSTSYAKYGEEPKGQELKVFRGGSWFDFGNSQRSANRHKHEKHKKYTTIGLRLVWSDE